jgi:hypothetical protein
MSLPVLLAFAGVLVAAVATGMIVGRCVRRPRVCFVAWAAGTLGLTAALGAAAMGWPVASGRPHSGRSGLAYSCSGRCG